MTTFNELVDMTIAKYDKLSLFYNDEETPMIHGWKPIEQGGYYKNGYTCSKVDGVNGKYKYYKVFVYTVAGGYVDIEEKWLIRINSDGKYTIKSHRGWNDVDLMKYRNYGDAETHLIAYMKCFLKRYIVA